MDMTKAIRIIREHFTSECQPLWISDFEVKYAIEVPEKGIIDVLCNIRCALSTEMREMQVWLKTDDYSIEMVKEISRRRWLQ